MRPQTLVQEQSYTAQRHLHPARQLLVFLAVFFCLVGITSTQDSLWAQLPMPPAPSTPALPPPPPPEEEEEEFPEITNFSAVQYPGEDHWLISGQLVGCTDPSNVVISIDGTLSASTSTDSLGYFDVLVIYDGVRDLITADAEYEGLPLGQVYTLIGE